MVKINEEFKICWLVLSSYLLVNGLSKNACSPQTQIALLELKRGVGLGCCMDPPTQVGPFGLERYH